MSAWPPRGVCGAPLFLADGSQPVTEEIGIDPRLYPGAATAFDIDLHEHPPEELRRIGQALALLALGPAGLAALRERRRETSASIGIAAAAVGHGRLYVGAGRKGTRLKNLAMLEVYDPVKRHLERRTCLRPAARWRVGNVRARPTPSSLRAADRAMANPAILPTARHSLAAAVVGNILYLIGGGADPRALGLGRCAEP